MTEGTNLFKTELVADGKVVTLLRIDNYQFVVQVEIASRSFVRLEQVVRASRPTA